MTTEFELSPSYGFNVGANSSSTKDWNALPSTLCVLSLKASTPLVEIAATIDSFGPRLHRHCLAAAEHMGLRP